MQESIVAVALAGRVSPLPMPLAHALRAYRIAGSARERVATIAGLAGDAKRTDRTLAEPLISDEPLAHEYFSSVLEGIRGKR